MDIIYCISDLNRSKRLNLANEVEVFLENGYGDVETLHSLSRVPINT